MEEFEDLLPKYKFIFIIALLIISFLLVIGGLSFYFYNKVKSFEEKEEITDLKEEYILESEEDKEEVPSEFIVDIKGEVKNPGVYTLEKNSRVNDVIKKAGGLTSNASTFSNNLSMKIKDEMVIIIYSKKEIEELNKTKETEEKIIEKCNEVPKNDSCITNNITKSEAKEKSVTNKISINSANKNELMSLSGIGESKANSIIKYRENKKFESIEEIKKVSGIGDSLFEKIKDSITI